MKTIIHHLRYVFHSLVSLALYELSDRLGRCASRQWHKADRASIDEINTRRALREVTR